MHTLSSLNLIRCRVVSPSREVPISWSSIARICACADMAAAERAGGRLSGRGWGAERALAGGGNERKGWGEVRRCLGGRCGLEACEWGDGGVAGVSGLRFSRRRGRGRWQHPREQALASSLSVRFLRQARHGLRPTLAASRHRHPPEAVNPP